MCHNYNFASCNFTNHNFFIKVLNKNFYHLFFLQNFILILRICVQRFTSPAIRQIVMKLHKLEKNCQDTIFTSSVRFVAISWDRFCLTQIFRLANQNSYNLITDSSQLRRHSILERSEYSDLGPALYSCYRHRLDTEPSQPSSLQTIPSKCRRALSKPDNTHSRV